MYLQKIIKFLFSTFLFVGLNLAAPLDKKIVDIRSVQKEVDSIMDINLRQIESCANCVHLSTAKAQLPGLSPYFDAGGANCTGFIDKQGAYGPIGQSIVKYLNGSNSDIFLSDAVRGMSTSPYACPKWSELTREERIHFWVWTMASIAWAEARCMSSAVNTNATNGVGVGLFQLDERRDDRYWRGPNCAGQSVSNRDINTLCALDIMSELLKGSRGIYKSNGKIYSNSNSYWEHLRRSSGGDIGNLIKRYSLCH